MVCTQECQERSLYLGGQATRQRLIKSCADFGCEGEVRWSSGDIAEAAVIVKICELKHIVVVVVC